MLYHARYSYLPHTFACARIFSHAASSSRSLSDIAYIDDAKNDESQRTMPQHCWIARSTSLKMPHAIAVKIACLWPWSVPVRQCDRGGKIDVREPVGIGIDTDTV